MAKIDIALKYLMSFCARCGYKLYECQKGWCHIGWLRLRRDVGSLFIMILGKSPMQLSLCDNSVTTGTLPLSRASLLT